MGFKGLFRKSGAPSLYTQGGAAGILTRVEACCAVNTAEKLPNALRMVAEEPVLQEIKCEESDMIAPAACCEVATATPRMTVVTRAVEVKEAAAETAELVAEAPVVETLAIETPVVEVRVTEKQVTHKSVEPQTLRAAIVVTNEQIAAKAWEIWQREGCPENQALDHWLAAERELAQK